MIVDLRTFPVIYETQVRWGEMDSFKHVNNAVYFKYFESARIAYLEKIDYATILAQTGVGIILSSVNCKFISPLVYPDNIQIGAKITEIEEDRFIMDYAIYSSLQNKIAAIGSSVVVAYDYKSNRKTTMPKSFTKL